MEWSNYLFANGGQYYDAATGSARSTRRSGRKALEDYTTNIAEVRPARRRELQLRRGVQRGGAGQGLQLHHLQLLPRRRTTIRRSRRWSARWRSPPVPGTAGLNGAWGWAIPKSSPIPTPPGPSSSGSRARRSPRSARCSAARRPAPTSSTTPRCSRSTRTSRRCKALCSRRHNFPTFTYTPEFVEVLGRELSLAVDRREDAGGSAGAGRDRVRRLLRRTASRKTELGRRSGTWLSLTEIEMTARPALRLAC